MTPYVNPSPIQKRVAFEARRGLPVDKAKLEPRNAISIIMDPGTASGVPPQPLQVRQSKRVEKNYLKSIMKRLDDLDLDHAAEAKRNAADGERMTLQERRRMQEKTKARARLERELKNTEIKPITYEGNRITCPKDLLKYVDLNLMNPKNITKAKSEYSDDLYNQLLDALLPERSIENGEKGYLDMSQGDIIFNLTLADQLTYDIVDEAILKKRRTEELAREQERQLMKMKRQAQERARAESNSQTNI